MNRYDVASVAKFNPLSYQEIMAAPLAMRQKHDASIAQAEAMRIKTDPYSKHYNRALELKQQMDNEIAKNVDTLNKEGYNPTTFQNITKLNRQYNDMISPTGEIGQINAENINIKKINEEYDKLGKEKNWGQETVDYWKNKALKEYNEKPLYDSNGRILSYSGPEGVVNKVDYNKRLHELASSAKMSVSEFSNAVTKLGMDEKSGYNVANKNSEAHKLGDNYARVKDAYDTLKKEIYDPTSEVHKSMRYEGRNPESLLDILKTQSNIYRQNVKSDEYSKDINPFGPGPGSGEDPDNPNGFGITEAANTFVSDKYSEKKYSDIQNIIDKNKNSKTPEGRQAYYEATTFKNNLDKSLKNNKEYVGLVKQKDELLNKLNISSEVKDKIKKSENGISTLFHGTGVGTTSMLIDGKKIFLKRDDLNKIQKYEKDLNNIFSKKSEIIKNTILHNNVESTDYKLTAFTPKQESILNLANKNIQSLFQTTPENIKSYVNIESVGVDGNLRHSVSSDDKEKIAKILSRAKEGDVKLQVVSSKGISGRPEYVLRVTPNNESEGIGNGFLWMSKDKIKDKPIDIRVSFKQNVNNTDIDNVNDLITNRYLPLAGEKGKNLATTMKAYSKYGNQSYGDFEGDEIVDSRVLNLVQNEVINNPQSPYANLTTKDAIKRYYKHHKDELINFHDN